MEDLTAKQALDIVRPSKFLGVEDWGALEGMMPELLDTNRKKQIWRTETEMRISVLNDMKHPTDGSKYWQAVREQACFFDALVSLSFEYRKNNLKLRRLAVKLASLEDELDIEECQIDIEELDYRRADMELQAKDRMRELKLWSEIKGELESKGGFDKENVDTDQLVGYAKRFILEAHNAMATGANLSVSEAGNLFGLAQAAVSKANEKGLLGQVLAGLPLALVDAVLPAIGFKKLEA